MKISKMLTYLKKGGNKVLVEVNAYNFSSIPYKSAEILEKKMFSLHPGKRDNTQSYIL